MRLFTIDHLRCSYDRPYREGISHVVLQIEHLELERGQRIFIVGESGIGKSTILETLGMMNNTIVPSVDTRFLFHDEDGRQTDLCRLWQDSDGAQSAFRRKNYSFIFQSTNLMRNFTAYENVAYTRMLQGYPRNECFELTRQVLKSLGLEHVGKERLPQELSGGQQQRLAFARAILPDFAVLFGDEPTGNLDSENAMRVMAVLAGQTEQRRDASAIIVSHDMHLATTFADVIIKIRKTMCPGQNDGDENIAYGFIDETCVYRSDAARLSWTNGVDHHGVSEFEDYLRKK